MKTVILINAVASTGLFLTGLIRLMMRDPLSGTGYEGSALMVIVGLCTLFLIPLEICLPKSKNVARLDRQSASAGKQDSNVATREAVLR